MLDVKLLLYPCAPLSAAVTQLPTTCDLSTSTCVQIEGARVTCYQASGSTVGQFANFPANLMAPPFGLVLQSLCYNLHPARSSMSTNLDLPSQSVSQLIGICKSWATLRTLKQQVETSLPLGAENFQVEVDDNVNFCQLDNPTKLAISWPAGQPHASKLLLASASTKRELLWVLQAPNSSYGSRSGSGGSSSSSSGRCGCAITAAATTSPVASSLMSQFARLITGQHQQLS